MRGEGRFEEPGLSEKTKSKESKIPPALALAIAAALTACAGSDKRIAEETVVPGSAVVEAREKRGKKDVVYNLLRREVAEIAPERMYAFEAILEDETLRHLQNKFSSPEDKWRDKRDYIFYTKKIDTLFSPLKNPARRKEIMDAIARHCQDRNVPFDLAVAVMANENAGGSKAVSSAGARGLFQVMPNTAREMGVSEKEMRTLDGQVKAGVRALAAYYRKYHQWGVAMPAYNGGSYDIAKFLNKHGFLPKKNIFKSVTRNFGGDQEEFYGGNIPDIVSMYEKSFDKQALGYPFRVIAMSRVLDAIDWGEEGQPMRIRKEKLPHPEFWDKRKSTETKSGDSGVKKPQRQRAGAKAGPMQKRTAPAVKQKILASTWKRQRR